MKTSWEKKKREHLDYCFVRDGYVTVGANDGTIESDAAGAVTFEAFLAGQYQDSIRETFGAKVLEEVIAAVIALRDAPPHATDG
ncbi:MAG: hypothetical protein RLZZ519_1196 [Bacteroidota bacterium]|jgi:hypothetical protein